MKNVFVFFVTGILLCTAILVFVFWFDNAKKSADTSKGKIASPNFYMTSDNLVSQVSWSSLIHQGEWQPKFLQKHTVPELTRRSCWYSSKNELIVWRFRDQAVIQKGGGILQISVALPVKYSRSAEGKWTSTMPSNITLGALYFCNNVAFENQRSWSPTVDYMPGYVPGCVERVPLARWDMDAMSLVTGEASLEVSDLNQPLNGSNSLHSKLLAEQEPVYFYLAFEVNPKSVEMGLCDLHMYTLAHD